MSELLHHTTANGHEIQHTRETLSFTELQDMLVEYGICGSSADERLESLRQTSAESTALLITDINKRLQGSDETLVHKDVVQIGGKNTIQPADRYKIFVDTIDKIADAPVDINPERVGDILALTTVILHPFTDGNGRTARIIGLIFRDQFDAPEAGQIFEELVASRDVARQRDTVLQGYIPLSVLQVGSLSLDGPAPELTSPKAATTYINQLFKNEGAKYATPFPRASLKKNR